MRFCLCLSIVVPQTAACAAVLQPDHKVDSAHLRDRRRVGATLGLRQSCEGSSASLYSHDVDVGFDINLHACMPGSW